MKRNLLAFLLLPLSLLFFSCSEEEADYSKAKAPNTDEVYFSNEAPTEYLLENGQNSVTIPLNRLKTDKPLTVEIVSEAYTVAESAKARVKGLAPEGTTAVDAFTIPATASFEEGSDVTEIEVTFNFDDLVPEQDYYVTLKVNSDQTTEYGDDETTVVIKYAPWSEPELLYEDATYTYAQFASGTYAQEVYVSQNLLNENQKKYILKDWFYGVDLEVFFDATQVIPGTDYVMLSVAPQYSGYTHSSYGQVFVADSYYYWHDFRGQDVTFYQVPSYYVPELGRFILNVAYFVSAGYFGYGEEYLQFPGFEQKDFTVELGMNSNFITPGGDEGVMIDFGFGADVASVKYAIFPGELSEEEREQAADDIHFNRVSSVTTTEEGPKQFFLSEMGTYTIVAVAYDEDGKRQDVSYLTFDFSPMKGWDNKWIGDFTYTQFFADYDEETKESYPAVDEGLVCQQNSSDTEKFKILDWGFGTDFKFTFTDGGDVEVDYQPIGYEEEGYGPVYVTDLAAYVGSDAYGKSSYDPESGVFTFVVYYPIVGTNYSYGYGAEYYEITDNAVKARVDAAYFAAKRKAPKKVKKTNRFAQLGVNINAAPMYNHIMVKNLKLK